MAQEIFERYEKKYLLTAKQYHSILPELKHFFRQDDYGKYTIYNIYYDTPDYQLICASLDKPYYKEKLRLRSYGMPSKDNPVFMEIKKKYDGIVYKRRAQMTLEESVRYIRSGIHPHANPQILRELDYFFSRYCLIPKVFLAYDREAYAGIYGSGLRITFDTAIRYRESSLSLSAGSNGTLLLPPSMILMEVKLPGVMPYWMAQLFSKYDIYPVSFSKYGTYYQQKISMLQKGIHKYA